MRLNSFLAFMLCLIFSGSLYAQTTDELKKQIATVKKSNLYIYGEATAETEQDAKDLAEEILNYEINKWVATQKKLRNTDNIILTNKKELYTTMSLPRGNMFRSFIYVKKSDIQKGENATVIANDAPASDMVSNVEEISSNANGSISPIAKELAELTDYLTLASKIMDYKKKGKIKEYEHYANLKNPVKYYLALYNAGGVVQAILTPGKPRKNVKTGEEDTTNNYPGCGAIGFIVK